MDYFESIRTFSLALSWSNISWISSFQSSCRDWKDSAGISKKPDSSIAVSWSRILVKEGRAWGSTFQQSRAGERNKHHHRQTVSCQHTTQAGTTSLLVSESIYPVQTHSIQKTVHPKMYDHDLTTYFIMVVISRFKVKTRVWLLTYHIPLHKLENIQTSRNTRNIVTVCVATTGASVLQCTVWYLCYDSSFLEGK